MKGHLLESLNEKNSWLIFQVQWKGYDLCNAAEEWVKEDDLACEAKVIFPSPCSIFPRIICLDAVFGSGNQGTLSILGCQPADIRTVNQCMGEVNLS